MILKSTLDEKTEMVGRSAPHEQQKTLRQRTQALFLSEVEKAGVDSPVGLGVRVGERRSNGPHAGYILARWEGLED
jgi:hypothetical protein